MNCSSISSSGFGSGFFGAGLDLLVQFLDSLILVLDLLVRVLDSFVLVLDLLV